MSIAVLEIPMDPNIKDYVSMDIYSNFKPTYLYIKRHSITGLLYLGKTIHTKDPCKYLGSGVDWVKHYKQFGKKHIETLWVSKLFTDAAEIYEFATFISEELDIVKSPKFANKIPENGINGGGDCHQMHTSKVRIKVIETCIEKYGTEYAFTSKEILNKAKITIEEKYGPWGSQFTNDKSIIKRNNTNLLLYGNKCAANSNGGIEKSQKHQQNMLSRPIIAQIKLLAIIKKITLNSGWYYNNDEWLISKFNEIAALPIHYCDTSTYNKRQLNRHLQINRKNVQLLILGNILHPLKLGRNWFQISDERLNIKIEEVKLIHSELFDIVLQTYCRYLEATL